MMLPNNREDGVLTISPKGSIDGGNANTVRDLINNTVASEDQAVILDLEQIAYISSAGLRIIAMLNNQYQKQGRPMYLCAANDQVSKVLFGSGFQNILPITPTRREAQRRAAGAVTAEDEDTP